MASLLVNFMEIMDSFLEQTKSFARRAHEGQVRKYTGEPYVEHVLAVGLMYQTYAESVDTNALYAAILHYTVEDCDVTIEEIQSKNRRHPDFPDDIIFQLVWNDPEDKDYRFRPNNRGQRARIFGKKGFEEFVKNIDAKIMFRAHQVFPKGIKKFFDGKLVSVFSATYGPRVQPKIVRLCNDLSVETIELNT